MFITLVSAADLAQNLENPRFVVFDCRADLVSPTAGAAAYAAGHLPGAQYASLDFDLSDKTPGPNGEFRGRHPLPAKEAFVEKLREWGVSANSQVVAYDAQGGLFAARLWWMLRWVGHEAVALLDGGLDAWLAAGGKLATETRARPRGDLALQPSLVASVTAADVLANLQTQERTVVDARSADRFRGENETIDPVAGHIPGAKNRFFKDNLQANGLFKPAQQLRAEFGALLAAPEKAVMQCGSGASACVNLLAMEIAGLRGAALYPGSWSEWSADPSRPVATGAG